MKAKLEYKSGVTGSAQAPLSAALDVACFVWGWFGLSTLTVTSLRDGDHKLDSLHPRGYAADIRTSTIPIARHMAVLATLKGQLGTAYDVILETAATPGATGMHIHIEFDPEHNGGKNLV